MKLEAAAALVAFDVEKGHLPWGIATIEWIVSLRQHGLAISSPEGHRR